VKCWGENDGGNRCDGLEEHWKTNETLRYREAEFGDFRS